MNPKTLAASGGAVAAASLVGLMQVLGPSCPRTDACLTWLPPTEYTNNAPIPAGTVIDYFVYRDTKLVVTPPIRGIAGQPMAYNLRLEPPGFRSYTVAAIVATKVSAPSSPPATKLIRAPAPTEGAIEAPTDGGIEDVP